MYRSEDGDGGLFVVPALGGEGLQRKIAMFGYYPRWSPDSSQILFQTRFARIPNLVNKFYVVRLDGTPPREVLVDFIAGHKLLPTSAVWHPDGKRITLWVFDSAPSPRFWTVPIAGGLLSGPRSTPRSTSQRPILKAWPGDVDQALLSLGHLRRILLSVFPPCQLRIAVIRPARR